MAGMEVIPYLAEISGLASTSTLMTSTLSAWSTEISSRMGPTFRQGPHHSAQKSTMTGLSEFRTTSAKVASVAVFALLMVINSLLGIKNLARPGNAQHPVRQHSRNQK